MEPVLDGLVVVVAANIVCFGALLIGYYCGFQPTRRNNHAKHELKEVRTLKLQLKKAHRKCKELTTKLSQIQETRAVEQIGGMKPIGYITSCFKERRSTPRQNIVPSAVGELHFSKQVQPQESLDGVDGFSHLWVIWVFHQNTSSVKANKNNPKNVLMGLKAKIKAPRLFGKKTGLFSCRTPHRPNPIGLTLMTIEHVDLTRGVIRLGGVDVVDGTPVLDIKPYVPYCDSRPNAVIPPWISAPFVFKSISFVPEMFQALNHFVSEAKHYHEPQELCRAVSELLFTEVPGRPKVRRLLSPEQVQRFFPQEPPPPAASSSPTQLHKRKGLPQKRKFIVDPSKVYVVFLDGLTIEYVVTRTDPCANPSIMSSEAMCAALTTDGDHDDERKAASSAPSSSSSSSTSPGAGGSDDEERFVTVVGIVKDENE